MLKKISVKQLTVGMHLKEFCGSWMEHPFWRNAFVITDPKDIDAILASSIKEVWIDTAKGLDVAPGEAAVSETESETQVDAELSLAAAAVRDTAPSPGICPASRIHHAAEADAAGTILAGRHQQVLAMLVEPISLREIPVRCLRPVVTATA